MTQQISPYNYIVHDSEILAGKLGSQIWGYNVQANHHDNHPHHQMRRTGKKFDHLRGM